MITEDKIYKLVQAMVDGSDGHDIEAYAEEVYHEDEVEDFMESYDGSDLECLFEDYVEDKTDDEVEKLFKDFGIE